MSTSPPNDADPETAPRGQIQVFIAVSLDGYIAGEHDELDWLPGTEGGPPTDPSLGDRGYGDFIQKVGAMLMGRRTYDVVSGFPGDWPYGDLPVLVATRRPLDPKVATVSALQGGIHQLLDHALEVAGGRNVYLDGGDLIRQALDAGRVHRLTLTLIPILLGRGRPLFSGTHHRHNLRLVASHHWPDGLVQVTYAVG